jgi:hypothetical protein
VSAASSDDETKCPKLAAIAEPLSFRGRDRLEDVTWLKWRLEEHQLPAYVALVSRGNGGAKGDGVSGKAFCSCNWSNAGRPLRKVIPWQAVEAQVRRA